jgi:hypothetical protein
VNLIQIVGSPKQKDLGRRQSIESYAKRRENSHEFCVLLYTMNLNTTHLYCSLSTMKSLRLPSVPRFMTTTSPGHWFRLA